MTPDEAAIVEERDRADAAEARLAAVRALPERWEAEAARKGYDTDNLRDCAAELRAALGETS